ncbi:hypothetical protein MA16_Dca026091 [Dendrobium catenatum]|uniref:Uncharacterized protein n=1 Tax=Dendrobium catenatum TaxID=906689 RepID=A0A2I0VG60_9ASPA|nr:hypothetical protein MA16_Dca026091 [Dendrobium catenatum]
MPDWWCQGNLMPSNESVYARQVPGLMEISVYKLSIHVLLAFSCAMATVMRYLQTEQLLMPFFQRKARLDYFDGKTRLDYFDEFYCCFNFRLLRTSSSWVT